jgi:hypothetical protein
MAFPTLLLPRKKKVAIVANKKIKGYYPKVEYSESRILKDTKNILKQNFVEKYCKQMQVVMTF